MIDEHVEFSKLFWEGLRDLPGEFPFPLEIVPLHQGEMSKARDHDSLCLRYYGAVEGLGGSKVGQVVEVPFFHIASTASEDMTPHKAYQEILLCLEGEVRNFAAAEEHGKVFVRAYGAGFGPASHFVLGNPVDPFAPPRKDKQGVVNVAVYAEVKIHARRPDSPKEVCALLERDARTLCRKDPSRVVHEVMAPASHTHVQWKKITCVACRDELERISR